MQIDINKSTHTSWRRSIEKRQETS